MRSLILLFIATLLFSGCVSAPKSNSATIANAAAAAQKRGDWTAAARLWEEAIQKENGFWKPELSRAPKILAIYYYELGRSLGVLRRYEEAEKNLLQALDLDEKSSGPIGMDLVELIRLNHARGDQTRAVSFFEQVSPRLDEVSESNPAAYIAFLREASEIFQALGKVSRAADLKVKAERFAVNHPEAKFPKDYGWTPYAGSSK